LSIHWPIIRRCITHPTAVAVVDDQRSYKAIELLIAALVLADTLDARGASDRVAIALPCSGMFPIAALAAWISGRTIVPINFLLKRDEMQYILDDSGCDTFVTVGPLLEFMQYTPSRVKVLKLEDVKFKQVPQPRWPARKADEDLGVLLYTSGATGKPKGVMLSHGNITSNLRMIRKHINFTSKEVMMGVLPQFHTFGLTVLTALPLTVGAKVVYTAKFVPSKIVGLMREHKATAFIGIPSMYNALCNVKTAMPEDLASLYYAVSGGEPLPQAVADNFKAKFGVTIAEGYGLTETSPVTNWCRPNEYKRGSVGQALPEVEQQIVDLETGSPLGPDIDGEIRMRGPNLMQGYLNLPDMSRSALDDKGFLRTGDIGHLDADGHLFITGRLKEMLIIAGENVFPREIEEALNSHPAIKDSGVVGISDHIRGEVPMAFIELKEGETFDQQNIFNHLKTKIAGFKIPKEIRVVEALPRNATGKVMRRELKVLAQTPK